MNINRQLGAIFQQMADVHTILGDDRFRINAYARSARALDHLGTEVIDDMASLTALDGIGKSTAQKIVEFLQTGKIVAFEELMGRIPPGLIGLLNIPGLGPKTIATLWNQAGIESLEDLKAKLQTDELTALPRMGKKTLDKLRKSIAFAEKSGGRVRLGMAMGLAHWFVEQLDALPQVQRVQYAGSLRRGRETIGDLDLLVAADPQSAKSISEAFTALEPVTEILLGGQTKTSVRIEQGMQVDLRIVSPDQFGAALMYFTGSQQHNVAMRQLALKQGMSLNEYALTRDGEPVAAQTEQAVYEALGLAWIPPELREDHGELALAQSKSLPKLVTLADIGADLHTHTTASDGSWSIREITQHAIARGYHTLAITDHSKGQAQANGLSEQRLEQHIADIRQVAEELKDEITLLAGSEVDILADGSLDYPDSLLAQLDVVVASPHAALTQEPDKATARLLKAIENPYVTMIGHPTGRLILRREGLSPDMPRVIEAAAQRGIALEINANHYRLDLKDDHARMAIAAGVKLAINTDAHGPADFDQLVYGLFTARRAGAAVEHVINCMDQQTLAAWLQSTRL